jgi:hypothetical protein
VLLLDAFVLGALVSLFLVQRLLVRIMKRLLTGSAQGEILNVLDHLLPYWAGWIVALLGLLLVTAGLGLWRRADQPSQPSQEGESE